MSDDPRELIPKGPGRFRTVTGVPIIFALILVLSVAGAVLWNSLHKKKTSQGSPEQKSKDAVTQSKNDSAEPDYLNYGRFTKAGQPLPPNVPDLSGGKKAGGSRKLSPPPSSAAKASVPGNLLPAPPSRCPRWGLVRGRGRRRVRLVRISGKFLSAGSPSGSGGPSRRSCLIFRFGIPRWRKAHGLRSDKHAERKGQISRRLPEAEIVRYPRKRGRESCQSF